MPRFFFDVLYPIAHRDEDGAELLDLASIRREVRAHMADILTSQPRDRIHIRIDVRNEAGEQVLTATLLMAIDWC